MRLGIFRLLPFLFNMQKQKSSNNIRSYFAPVSSSKKQRLNNEESENKTDMTTELKLSPQTDLKDTESDQNDAKDASIVLEPDLNSLIGDSSITCIPIEQMGESWQHILHKEFDKPYFKKLDKFIQQEAKSQVIYPPRENILRAFELCSFGNLKVVIIGQDPYHGPNQVSRQMFNLLRF